jgi:hypothetical protein
MKKLILFVEGEGDRLAVPTLVKRLIKQPWQPEFQLDPAPFRIGSLDLFRGPRQQQNQQRWTNWLNAAMKRPGAAGILQILDGDARNFCARREAIRLAELAATVGAGSFFSFSSVFACCEYESWLLAGIESLAGKPLPDGQPEVPQGTVALAGDLESAPRNAKGKLAQLMDGGYKPATHQDQLSRIVDLDTIRSKNLRSFRRLENATNEIVAAILSGNHIATPSPPR